MAIRLKQIVAALEDQPGQNKTELAANLRKQNVADFEPSDLNRILYAHADLFEWLPGQGNERLWYLQEQGATKNAPTSIEPNQSSDVRPDQSNSPQHIRNDPPTSNLPQGLRMYEHLVQEFLAVKPVEGIKEPYTHKPTISKTKIPAEEDHTTSRKLGLINNEPRPNNPSFIDKNTIKQRHYILKGSPKNNYWVRFHKNVIEKYINLYHYNFSLIVAGDKYIPDDFYVLPYKMFEPYLVSTALHSYGWIFNICNHSQVCVSWVAKRVVSRLGKRRVRPAA